MKVYIILESIESDGEYILDAYSTKEAAEKVVEELSNEIDEDCDEEIWYEVLERELI